MQARPGCTRVHPAPRPCCLDARPPSLPRSMFVILSFVKIFHWLVQDRVDFIETTPNVSRLQHARIVTFTLVLLVGAPSNVQVAPAPAPALHGIWQRPALFAPTPCCPPRLWRLAAWPLPAALPQAIDVAFLKFSLHETLNSRSAHGGVSVFLLFAFEYTVQASTIVLTFTKYCL